MGDRLHADGNDCGLSISFALTVATVHDSQVAIPRMKRSSAKVDDLYHLMDDAGPSHVVGKGLGHVPLVDKNSRGKEIVRPARRETATDNEGTRDQSTVAERFNSRMKEQFGANHVMVRGAQKVKMHLMFGVPGLFTDHLIEFAT